MSDYRTFDVPNHAYYIVPENYSLSTVQNIIPEARALFWITKTPDFGLVPIELIGDGVSTIAQLYALYVAVHSGYGDLAQRLIEEARARGAKDDDLQSQITALKEGAGQAYAFDNTAQLDAWIAGSYTRPDGVMPSDLHTGAALFMYAVNEPDYWWSAEHWQAQTPPYYYEQEVKIDLSAYLTKEDAARIYAPIKAPAFENDGGAVPTSTDYDIQTAPEKQIAIVKWQRITYNTLLMIAAGILKRDDEGNILQLDDEGAMAQRQDEGRI